MTRLERARRVVLAAYARRYSDGLTLELVERLERENAELHALRDEVNRHRRPPRGVTGLLPSPVRRAMASVRFSKSSDYIMQEYVTLLREDSASVSAEIRVLTPAKFSPRERYVVGRVVAGVLLVGTLVGGAAWLTWSGSAGAFVAGFRDGRATAGRVGG
jgi:hypothetical protein